MVNEEYTIKYKADVQDALSYIDNIPPHQCYRRIPSNPFALLLVHTDISI